MKPEVKTNKQDKTKKNTNKNIKKTVKKRPQKKKKNMQRRKRIITVISLIIILLSILVLILFSGLFNIKKITVINNSKITTEEIIKNSTLAVGNNMFKTLNTTIRENIKKNPYIEDVKITKKLDGEIILDIKERTPTYMLQRENDYVYINNQGYILEISQTPLDLPIIRGNKTRELTPGGRLEVDDLKKLDTVIQIMEAAKSNGINEIITTIDISDGNNFILEIPNENKTVQFGDGTDINVKILWIVALVEKEKGIAGEIVLNVPDIKKVYFREKV